MSHRGCGILLHITSLDTPYGVGDFGPSAYAFVDFLEKAKQRYWQILPLNPTDTACDSSPYHSISAFALNPLLISPDLLVQDHYLKRSETENFPGPSSSRVLYEEATRWKNELHDKAFRRFREREEPYEYKTFCKQNSWLEDYAIFRALKNHFNMAPWSDWPVNLKLREVHGLKMIREKLADAVGKEKFLQFILYKQWTDLKKYANKKGIHIIGDIPIYLDYDSADIWTCPDIVKLDQDKKPYAVSGVPPDYFSATGQLWSNPVYDWDVLRSRGYDWWIQRIGHNISLFDFIRVDHFRGLVSFWEVPSSETTAINGKWVEARAEELFTHLSTRFPCLPIIAEDLGVITPEVKEVMNHFHFPGMRVLLFAFGPGMEKNAYIPHNHIHDCVLYTGTHDNNTVRGWFEKEAGEEDRNRLREYLGRDIAAQDLPWEFIRMAMMSVANIAIIPMQDILSLDASHRMNIPGTSEGNWRWKLGQWQITSEIIEKLRKWTLLYGRSL